MKQLIVVILVVFGYRTYGISISFDPAKPAFGDSVTISCRRSTSSTASVSWELNSAALTVCDATMDDICIPSPTGHTFSTDVSAKVFNLSLASVALTDCKTYTCTDTVTTSDTDSNELLIAKYDSSESVLTEPGAFSSGTITLTTGCVLSPTDVTVSWKKVKENNEEDDLDYEVKPPTADATGCTDTCHSETSEKVVSSFVHTEYSESDCEEVTFRAYIRHSSYAVESVKNSAGKYRVKKDCGCPSLNRCDFSKEQCGGCWFGIVMAPLALIAVIVILILKFVVGVKFPGGLHNSQNNRTSPNCTGSKAEKPKSTSGKPQLLPNDEKPDPARGDTRQTTLHIEEGSADYTNKKPPQKLKELDEAGSDRHHISGRPLPDIGKYNKT